MNLFLCQPDAYQGLYKVELRKTPPTSSSGRLYPPYMRGELGFEPVVLYSRKRYTGQSLTYTILAEAHPHKSATRLKIYFASSRGLCRISLTYHLQDRQRREGLQHESRYGMPHFFVMILTISANGLASTQDLIDLQVQTTLAPIFSKRTSIISSFNQLANKLYERDFYLSSFTDLEIATIRNRVCGELGSDGDAGPISKDDGLVSVTAVQNIPQVANDGNEFTNFLREEQDILTTAGVSGPGREFALILAIQSRPFLTNFNNESIRDSFSQIPDIYGRQFSEGMNLLCLERHSPANNQSTASWRSWLWHGGNF